MIYTRSQLKSIFYSFLFLFGLSSTLLAKPMHERLWVGMPVRHFNALDLGPIIFTQSTKSTLTEFGVVKLNTASVKRYFDLKHRIWKGVMVDFQNNQLAQYTLQGDISISPQKMKELFSDLLRLHGTQFSLNNYRSLSKKGYSLIWHQKNRMASLNIALHKNNKCSVTLKKSFFKSKPKEQKLEESAIAALEPFLGKNFHEVRPLQVASDSKTDDQLDKLLSN